MANRFIGRKPEREDNLKSLTLPGDVKERLQFKPLTPAKKKPVGENWRRFKSEGSVTGDDAVRSERAILPMRKLTDPSYDDVNGQERTAAIRAIDLDGYTVDRDAMADRGTEQHNEHLYEEVVDKQTGKKSLLFRANYFDRI
jgi:hypothetical protein